jgi:glucokinase
MENQKFTIGIDIGGTNTVSGIVTDDGECVGQTQFLTQECRTIEDFRKKLVSTITQLCLNQKSYGRLAGIGIAAPAARFREGIIQSPANLKWDSVNIVSILQQDFDVPIIVVNDSKAAAVGEKKYGKAKGMSDFIVVTLGTGMGAGIFTGGKLLEGAHDMAGELGHVIVEENGRMCGCRRRGCIETYVSANGIRRTVFELLSLRTEESELRTISYQDLTSEKVHELAKKGDHIALEVLDRTGAYLGAMLANVAVSFDPEAIILTGGVVHSGNFLIDPTIESFNKHLLAQHRAKIPVIASIFRDGEGAIVGVCSLLEGMPNELEQPSSTKRQERVTSTFS